MARTQVHVNADPVVDAVVYVSVEHRDSEGRKSGTAFWLLPEDMHLLITQLQKAQIEIRRLKVQGK